MTSNHLLDKLFSVIDDDNSEQLWRDLLEKHEQDIGSLKELTFEENGWSILHFAAENLFTNLSTWLLSKGVPVDSKDNDGITPFLIALDSAIDCAIQEGEENIDFTMVNLLLDHGANENIVPTNGKNRDELLSIYGSKVKNQYELNVKRNEGS